jgi:hypothetical protein
MVMYDAKASLIPRLYDAHGEILNKNHREERHDGNTVWYFTRFSQWEKPYGYLSSDLREHCLIWYAMSAMHTVQEAALHVRYVGDKTGHYSYGNMLRTFARAYGVDPLQALHCWPVVMRQLALVRFCDPNDVPGVVRYPNLEKRAFRSGCDTMSH